MWVFFLTLGILSLGGWLGYRLRKSDEKYDLNIENISQGISRIRSEELVSKSQAILNLAQAANLTHDNESMRLVDAMIEQLAMLIKQEVDYSLDD